MDLTWNNWGDAVRIGVVGNARLGEAPGCVQAVTQECPVKRG
ncbi:hypothetical protein [Methanoculleus taiwanensis]|nr:hypothetical protein [Methanoculleus taiwanensis]